MISWKTLVFWVVSSITGSKNSRGAPTIEKLPYLKIKEKILSYYTLLKQIVILMAFFTYINFRFSSSITWEQVIKQSKVWQKYAVRKMQKWPQFPFFLLSCLISRYEEHDISLKQGSSITLNKIFYVLHKNSDKKCMYMHILELK